LLSKEIDYSIHGHLLTHQSGIRFPSVLGATFLISSPIILLIFDLPFVHVFSFVKFELY
jgi:hypothetical protein